MTVYDIAIIGAGSAGCVLANRLSADPKRTVVLVEAGPPKHTSFKVRAPGMYQTLQRGPLDWTFTTEPQPHSANRAHFWPRGKVLGGTSAINALVYIRGNAANYDAWNLDGWRYADVLPYFLRSEDNARGASTYHGATGPLAVSDPVELTDLSRAFVAALAAAAHVPVTDDFNGAEQAGAGHYQLTQRAGLRSSTAAAFLEPIRRARANLTILTNALATQLVVDGDRATSLRVRIGTREDTIEAREFVVASGAIGSPQLLLLSGIGPADELRALAIEPRHELPAVGKHLQDHLYAVTNFEVTHRTAGRKLSRAGLAWDAARYLATRRGPLASSAIEAGGFVRLAPAAPIPDLQFHFAPYGALTPTDTPQPLPYGNFACILPGLLYPRSRGEVRLRSADPAAPPIIDPHYLEDPADLATLVAGVRLAREVAATAPLAPLLGREVFPRAADVDDETLVRAHCNSIFHPTSTCRMGLDRATSVVDPATLRVHGLANVRVADASIMPAIVGGNTNAPTIMIAEKAADLIA